MATQVRASRNDNIGDGEDLFVPDVEDPDPFVVQLTNLDDTDFVVRHLKEWYRIPGNDTVTVPWTTACFLLGDPRKVNLDKKHQARLIEYRRLRVRYGVYENDELWDQKVPNLVVGDIQGRRIPMVADDPEGDRFTAVERSTTSTELLQRAVAQAQQQIDQLTQKLAAQESADVALNAGRHIQPDSDKRPRGRPRKPRAQSSQVVEDEG